MCFFFQAEDGIRDIGVTGVQTCALPIYAPEGLALENTAQAVLGSSADGSRRLLFDAVEAAADASLAELVRPDRKSVVEGKSGDLRGPRIIKKKKQEHSPHATMVNRDHSA